MTDEKDMGMSPDAEAPEESQDQQAENATPEDGAQDAPASDDPEIAEALGNIEEQEETPAEGEAEPGPEDAQAGDDLGEEDSQDEMLKRLQDLPQEDRPDTADDINFEDGTAVSSAEFQQLQQPASTPEARNIDLLMDVDLPVSIELGRTRLSIADILSLGPGSVVELSKLAGEPADLLINYKVVARGEVVVVDENFGLRITQLMTPEERLKALADE
jgi:flagellar motor switch protein FliN/FliY